MLVILQFDSPALPVLDAMVSDGRLPTLAALRRTGRPLEIDAAATFLQSSTYMTLCTGVDVREHGVYSAVPWSACDQRARFMYSFPGPPTIWDRLARTGRRCLVVDPILSWAPKHASGVYLSGWQFADRMVARQVSRPAEARDRLSPRYGLPPRLDDVYGTRAVKTLFDWRDRLVNAPGRVADAAVDLLKDEPFDLVWLNFAAAHKAGHHLWDPATVVGSRISEKEQKALQRGLRSVYQAVDTAIGRVLDAVPSNSDVIVFSPTGMAANTSRADLLPDMLDAVLNPDQCRLRSGADSPIWGIRSAVPSQWRDRLARAMSEDFVADLATRLYTRRDWSRTKAIAVPGENKGYIRVNMKGRERDGIVEPCEADELLTEIIRGLRTFTDPDGSPSIARVERTAEIAGVSSCLHVLPDLIVHWGDMPAANLSHVTSSEFGQVLRRGVGSGRSGNHVDDAWAILLEGSSAVCDLGRPMRITDVGATACALLGADTSGLSGASVFA